MCVPSTILVVEDDENIRELLSSMLEINGYQVFSASNGQDGIELARTQRPDLVLCDAGMPRGSGADVLRAVRENPATVGTTFLLMTGNPQFDLGKHSADGLLTKPFHMEEAVVLVEQFLLKRAA